ncbi:MAG: hypothetical protein QOK40_1867 [Miltoncostaeaceae bacterium]|nr:hypothetical protein [Miltoncostaeaceae bacterium]
MRSPPAVLMVSLAAVSIAAALPGARTGLSEQGDAARPPIRAAFYESGFPGAWRQGGAFPAARYRPSLGYYDGRRIAIVRRQIASMRYGGIAAGIASWTGVGSTSDQRVGTLLRAARGTSFRWTLELVSPLEAIAGQLAYIRARYGTDPRYLRVGGRFVVFVADAGTRCADAAGVVRAANRAGAYLMLEAFPGYRRCASQPAGWYEDPPAASMVAHLPGSATISPGWFPGRAATPTLARDLARWSRDVQALTTLHPRFELIDSFNDWASGSAVESASEWETESGHGAYLDLLHTDGAAPAATALGSDPVSTEPAAGGLAPPATVQVVPRPAAPPTVPPPATSPPPATTSTSPPPPLPPPPPPPADPVVAAAGDIACDSSARDFMAGAGSPTACQMRATSDLILGMPDLAAVLALGDLQYDSGSDTQFTASFDPTWGRFKPLIRPAIGNHEYGTRDQAGYYQYFGPVAGTPLEGWYSFDVGAWHLIALNSNCPGVGRCEVGSAQEAWLRADLAAHPNPCTLAFYHHPRFSSGQHLGAANTDAFWRDLHAAGVELVLTGHDHDYERFAPQTPDQVADPAGGIREFVVGTGGKDNAPMRTVQPNSEVQNADTFGVLSLTLHPTGYDWQFLPQPGKTFTDLGSGTCHGPNGPLP